MNQIFNYSLIILGIYSTYLIYKNIRYISQFFRKSKVEYDVVDKWFISVIGLKFYLSTELSLVILFLGMFVTRIILDNVTNLDILIILPSIVSGVLLFYKLLKHLLKVVFSLN